MATLEKIIAAPAGGDSGEVFANKINNNFEKINVVNGLVDVANAPMTSFVKNSYTGEISSTDTMNTSINKLQNRVALAESGGGIKDIASASMSGYTYSPASGGIATSDTLNTSLNKLQNRIGTLESTPAPDSSVYKVSQFVISALGGLSMNNTESTNVTETIVDQLGIVSGSSAIFTFSSEYMWRISLSTGLRKETPTSNQLCVDPLIVMVGLDSVPLTYVNCTMVDNTTAVRYTMYPTSCDVIRGTNKVGTIKVSGGLKLGMSLNISQNAGNTITIERLCRA